MDIELLRCIEEIEAAKIKVDVAQREAKAHHPRLAARLQIIKEELILVGVVAEHECGIIGVTISDTNHDTDSDELEEEVTQVDNPVPTPRASSLLNLDIKCTCHPHGPIDPLCEYHRRLLRLDKD